MPTSVSGAAISTDKASLGTTLGSAARIGDFGARARAFENGRTSFILTCLSWQSQGRFIEFHANPTEMVWNFVLRGTSIRTKGGQTQHIWRDSARGSTFFDEPRVNITFQTGNIMPIRIQDNSILRTPPGLVDLYEFMELMDEPVVLSDGTMNYRVIIHNSPLFPFMALYGWFPPEQEWSFMESAENPHSTSWSHTFVVRRSVPDFKNTAGLIYSFQQVHHSGSQGAIDAAKAGTGGGGGGNLELGEQPSDSVAQEVLVAEEKEKEKDRKEKATDAVTGDQDQLDPGLVEAAAEVKESGSLQGSSETVDSLKEDRTNLDIALGATDADDPDFTALVLQREAIDRKIEELEGVPDGTNGTVLDLDLDEELPTGTK